MVAAVVWPLRIAGRNYDNSWAGCQEVGRVARGRDAGAFVEKIPPFPGPLPASSAEERTPLGLQRRCGLPHPPAPSRNHQRGGAPVECDGTRRRVARVAQVAQVAWKLAADTGRRSHLQICVSGTSHRLARTKVMRPGRLAVVAWVFTTRAAGKSTLPPASSRIILRSGQTCRTVIVFARNGSSLRASHWLAPTECVRYLHRKIGAWFQIMATYLRAASILARGPVLRDHQRGGARWKNTASFAHLSVLQEVAREFLVESPFSIEARIRGESGTKTCPLLR